MAIRFRICSRIGVVATFIATLSTIVLATPSQAANPYQTFDSTVSIYNCSASVIKLPGSRDTDRALVMTNGHCIEPVFDRYLRRGEVVTNHSLNRLSNPYFKDISFYGGNTPRELTNAQLTDVVYATMDNTDLAILRTNKTYGQLKSSGVKVRPLSTGHPNIGTSIHIPSTYWNKSYSCKIDGFAHELHEGDWVWRDAMRYTASGCQVQPGSSGSPVVNSATGAIIGVNNTYVEGGTQCTLSNACEVDYSGNRKMIPKRGYATQTYYISTCFNGSLSLIHI